LDLVACIAFKLRPKTDKLEVADYQISGGPDWIRFDKFDVEAKSEANPSVDVLRLMLQRLLEDRFQLRVHRATKQDEVYALVIAKGGPKMRAVSDDSTDTNGLRNDAWRGVKAGTGHLFTDKGEIAGMAAFLTQIMDRPVMDQTGLDVVLERELADAILWSKLRSTPY
jgi:bla regulator protein blaR1